MVLKKCLGGAEARIYFGRPHARCLLLHTLQSSFFTCAIVDFAGFPSPELCASRGREPGRSSATRERRAESPPSESKPVRCLGGSACACRPPSCTLGALRA